MTNPIIQAISAAGRPLQNNGLASRLAEVQRLLNGQAPEVLFDRMMKTNPAFAQFVQQNAGRSPEELARAYGIDPELVRSLFR